MGTTFVEMHYKPNRQMMFMAGGSRKRPSYGDYLNLEELLSLQGDESISADEMHFIVVHQTFELWFKQVIRELAESRDTLSSKQVAEEMIPSVVHRLGRVTEIFRLMAQQWSVMETLSPQDFLVFRDGLGSASGFESYQMRELEILIGLSDEQRTGGMDPLARFRKMAQESENGAIALQRLESRMNEDSLWDTARTWLTRTPIMGSSPGDDGDEEVVKNYVHSHISAQIKHGEEMASRMSKWGMGDSEAIKARFASIAEGARDFLMPEGKIDRARAGLLFIESYRDLPLLSWPRTLIDRMIELEEAMVKWRHSHARMVERIIGRRIGTGGSSGVDYLDATTSYRVFIDLWSVRTILIKTELRPELINPEFYGFA
ncbi:MAG: tryptophan 2,3-dioxygenase family protein [Candidatus Thermoplasmatota archaeon]|nr:tryptophan 2,3-dioxygenase family protein [Candidatus Thermoplasmatota archaeon]